MQKFICTANLTKAPELRETSNGKSVATLSIAINRDYGDGTDYFNATVWDKQAENCAKYLDKGSKVAIVGTMQNRSYEDKDGVKKTVTEIQVREIEFLTFKEKEEKEETVTARRERPPLEEICGDNLPF